MLSPTTFGATSSEKRSSRQRPGTACEECRRRKLRCDGRQPQCEACFDAGIACINDGTQAPRGPKKGHMKALQARMAMLEKRLSDQQQQQNICLAPSMPCTDLLDLPSMDSIFNLQPSLPTPPPSETTANSNANASANAENMSLDLYDDFRMSSSLEAPTNPLYISDLLRTDLDQLYFERAHTIVPFLHQRRYFQWARKANKTESQTCLQYSMWTLAASLSAQQQHIRESLYGCTLKMLEAAERKDYSSNRTEFSDIEHVQARILMLIYEFMRTNHQRAWISAGRCFRLLQLMRLYEIDTPENVAARANNGGVGDPDPEAWIKTEEKRRTFWVAYSLDRFISIRGELPLTLNEQVIANRLPIPEEEFQKEQCIEMGFLSEAIIAVDEQQQQGSLSPFTESIILATICGRALSHRQQTSVERSYSNVPQHFWGRHEWLDEMLRTRVKTLIQHDPTAAQHSNPLLLFTKMVAQANVLYLCKVMDSMSWESTEYWKASVDFKQRALLAAKEIVVLSRSLARLSYFKIYPFTPLPLAMCTDFFKTHRYLDETVDAQVQEILDVLKDITSVNNLAQEYLSSSPAERQKADEMDGGFFASY